MTDEAREAEIRAIGARWLRERHGFPDGMAAEVMLGMSYWSPDARAVAEFAVRVRDEALAARAASEPPPHQAGAGAAWWADE